MCGIAGIVGRGPVNADAVGAMNAAMVHRGPDGDGVWKADDGRVALGNRRLAVLDLSRDAGQPMVSADGTLAITYNGELYNYLELRRRLQEEGVAFRTASDTEVVIEAYRRWGEACLDEFNGMFAFAVFDGRRDVLFCARDRFGEKPFLFFERPGVFAFASEYKALFALEGADVDVDAHGLFRFLRDPSRGLDHRRETVFRGVKQLMPAEKLVLDLGDLTWTAERYWSGDPRSGDDGAMAEADAVGRFRDLLTDAVRIRLRSDVPVGSCLSGGLDSSAITCLARRLAGDDRPYHVFTGRFPGSAADEGRWAGEIVAATGAIQHEAFPSADEFVAEAERFVWFNELPVDSASQYAQWCVFRLAADNGVTVLLDGQGADEVLGGYEQYFAPYMRARRRVLGAGEADAEERAIRDRYPLAFSTADQSWKTRAPSALRRMAARITGRGSDLLFGVRREFAADVAAVLGAPAGETLHQALRRDACNGFLTSLLRYGDRNSMAHSREVRLPFCDHRIAEFVFGLPERLIMGDAETKHLLREAMRGILPEPVRTRWNKQGFLPPHAQWFRDGLGELARETFASPSFSASDMWDAAWWRRAMRRLDNGEDALAVQIWKPVIAELWRRGFVERAARQPRTAPLAAADR